MLVLDMKKRFQPLLQSAWVNGRSYNVIPTTGGFRAHEGRSLISRLIVAVQPDGDTYQLRMTKKA